MNLLLRSLFAASLLALPAAAQKPEVTVYTYSGFASKWGPGPKLKAAFEENCGCTLTFVGVDDGVALLTRLRLEGTATKADVVVGLDQNLTVEAAATGLFAPHGIDTNSLALPVAWDDATFVPFDYGAFAVVYDTKALPTPPKSLKELVEGDPKQKIVIQDPRTSTPGLGLLLWVKAVYGDAAPEAWSKLRGRILTTTKSWGDAYSLFTKGEAPMVLSYTTSPAYHLIEEKTDRYAAAIFSEGHYPQIEVAAATKTSKQAALSKQFLAFLLSDKAQGILPTTNWMYPVTASAPQPDAFKTLPKPEKTLLLPADQVAKNRKAWTDEWLKALAQ
ncbi:thiamine transporter substrate binding subunit [Elstera cyanobacteriorum]|uniref:Thiamine-binding periplasmic protein n=1 Tax=Elstera cyanobacteriorum TaxID=2022747 RepID=A0A255XNI8_9PROT|nr:thiamine ABC transporter substrate binding subunit [Elstera cyanobacteriorum]OYQ18472.1 thiamine ABC transporter substrate binding subunit [Elstera cyanobacteriorum]GFZ80020.1 thiamine transporter substrate binding subunit [Elstera cyanobacteriorum]